MQVDVLYPLITGDSEDMSRVFTPPQLKKIDGFFLYYVNRV